MLPPNQPTLTLRLCHAPSDRYPHDLEIEITCGRATLPIQLRTWSTIRFSADRPLIVVEAQAVVHYPRPFGQEARLCEHLLPFLHYDDPKIISQPDRAALFSAQPTALKLPLRGSPTSPIDHTGETLHCTGTLAPRRRAY